MNEMCRGEPNMFETCRLSPVERDELLDIFLANGTWTRIYFVWRPNLPDEADNHLVELAAAGRRSLHRDPKLARIG